MPPPDLSFEITSKISVRADFDRRRVVISFESKDGRLIHLEGDYQTLERIHEEIRKHMEEL